MRRHPNSCLLVHSIASNWTAANGGDYPCQKPPPALVAAPVIVALDKNPMKARRLFALFVVVSSVARAMPGTWHALNKYVLNE